MNIQWANIHFLWLLGLLPILFIVEGKWKKKQSLVFSSLQLLEGVGGVSLMNRLLKWLKYIGLALLIIALAGPREEIGQIEASGIDIVLAVDISSSMLALDMEKNGELRTRLDIVKDVVGDFIVKRPNDRIGLVAFARNPYLVSPLTLNHEWLEKNVDRLRIGLVPDGTAIGSAIGMSVNRFRNIVSKSRIVILLTDGVNNAGKISPIAAAEVATAMKVKVYTVLAGEGGVVPMLRVDEQGNPITDRYGKMYATNVEVTVDTETLEKIAEMTGGKYYQAKNYKELENIYNEIDQYEKSLISMNSYAQYRELFIWPAGLALILFLMERLLSSTRYLRIP